MKHLSRLIFGLLLIMLTGCISSNEPIPPRGYTVIPGCIEDCKQASSLVKSVESCIESCYEIHYPP